MEEKGKTLGCHFEFWEKRPGQSLNCCIAWNIGARTYIRYYTNDDSHMRIWELGPGGELVDGGGGGSF